MKRNRSDSDSDSGSINSVCSNSDSDDSDVSSHLEKEKRNIKKFKKSVLKKQGIPKNYKCDVRDCDKSAIVTCDTCEYFICYKHYKSEYEHQKFRFIICHECVEWIENRSINPTCYYDCCTCNTDGIDDENLEYIEKYINRSNDQIHPTITADLKDSNNSGKLLKSLKYCSDEKQIQTSAGATILVALLTKQETKLLEELKKLSYKRSILNRLISSVATSRFDFISCLTTSNNSISLANDVLNIIYDYTYNIVPIVT